MFGNFGWQELLLVLLIVALVFGTARLRNIGGDLGRALRSFRGGLKGEQDDNDSGPPPKDTAQDKADDKAKAKSSSKKEGK